MPHFFADTRIDAQKQPGSRSRFDIQVAERLECVHLQWRSRVCSPRVTTGTGANTIASSERTHLPVGGCGLLSV
jgi:hypothetical protein